MRVAVYYANDDVRLEQRPCPQIGAGELLLRIKASGVCGSDVMEWYRKPSAPRVLGHEVAGVVERAGEGVASFAAGDRVVATHHVPCNGCRYCLTDRHSVCETLHGTSFDPGGFAEFVRLSPIHVERGTFPLCGGLSFEEGSFVEPLACVVRAQRLAGVGPGDSVAVLGSGISGLLQIQWARAQGAGKIFATDVNPHRVRAARSFGADLAVPADEGAPDAIREANGGRLVDRVLVCAGAAGAMAQALRLVDRGGTVLFFAPLPPGERLALDVADLWTRGVRIVHSYAGPPAEMRVALEILSSRRIDVASMITHRLGLAQTQEGFRRTAEGGASLKVIVEPER